MTLNDALNAIIDDGIEAARLDYAKPQDTLKRLADRSQARTNLNFLKADIAPLTEPARLK
jgi:hypothetical protein